MKFQIDNGTLQIVAESGAESLEIVNHYKIDPLKNLQEIAAGSLAHTDKPSGRDNPQWFEVSRHVDPAFFAPYAALLQRWTGFADIIPEIDAPKYPGGYCVNLCHTHIVERATMSADGFTFWGYCTGSEWNGNDPETYANRKFAEYVAAAVGHVKQEREFIELNNGLLKRNPNYMRRHAPEPRATSAVVFEALLQWWLASHATEGQKQIVAAASQNHKTVCKRDTLGDWLIREYAPGWRVAWDGPGALVSIADFVGA
jgi:hypothetical protein